MIELRRIFALLIADSQKDQRIELILDLLSVRELRIADDQEDGHANHDGCKYGADPNQGFFVHGLFLLLLAAVVIAHFFLRHGLILLSWTFGNYPQ